MLPHALEVSHRADMANVSNEVPTIGTLAATAVDLGRDPARVAREWDDLSAQGGGPQRHEEASG